MYRIHNLYAHECFEPDARPEDEDHHQLTDALGELMDVNEDMNEQRKAVAIATLATTLRRWQSHDDWPIQIVIYFAETFRSFSKDIRETVLFLLLPQIVKSIGNPQLVWYIDKAVEEEMYALLHLSFVEVALVSDCEVMRAMGAYALNGLPLKYWKDVEQIERREYLFKRALKDSAISVRSEITEK